MLLVLTRDTEEVAVEVEVNWEPKGVIMMLTSAARSGMSTHAFPLYKKKVLR